MASYHLYKFIFQDSYLNVKQVKHRGLYFLCSHVVNHPKMYPKQPTQAQKALAACTPRVSVGFFLGFWIVCKGFWVVFVPLWRLFDGCNYH